MSLIQQNRLERENELYANSGGISQNNCSEKFMPAFKNSETGEIILSRYNNGARAPFHLLDALPTSWLQTDSHKTDLKTCIISGFLLLGCFFDRQEAANFIAQR